MARKQCVGVAALFVAATLAGERLAWPQLTTGNVSGTVADGQGGVVPGATAVLVSETRRTRSNPVTTSAAGEFVIANVAPDTYTLEVALAGFRTIRKAGISVSPGDRVSLPPLVLEVGGAAETVEVTGAAAEIQAQSGERSFTISTTAVENLPIANRSFTDLVSLAPGTNGLARLGGGGFNNVTMDGVNIVDTGNNGVTFLVNVQAVAEVKVLTSSYQAEYGRSSGLQVAAVTRSGSNTFHGSLYDIERDSDWNANSWTNIRNGTAKPVVKERDWGYTVGGPVGKPGGSNAVFFFFSQEWRPRAAGGDVNRFRVPTALERQGDFSQSRDNTGALYNLIRDASLGLPCSITDTRGCFRDGGVLGRIPAGRPYDIGLRVLDMWPLPNSDEGYATTNSFNFVNVSPTAHSLFHQEALRGDYQASPRLRLTGKILQQDASRNPNQPGQQFPQGTSLINGFNDAVETRPRQFQYSATANYTLGSATFVEATWGMFQNEIGTFTVTDASNRNTIGLEAFPLLFPDAGVVDSRFYSYDRLAADAPPWFQDGRSVVPPGFSWGTRIANPPPNVRDSGCCINQNRTHDVSVSVTRVMGTHTAKAGFYYQRAWKAQFGARSAGAAPYSGVVSFANDPNNPLDSTFGFANAALGIFSTYQQGSRFIEGGYLYHQRDFYVQDNWRVTSSFTLDYGLRFVNQEPQYDTYGFQSNFLEQQWSALQAPALYRPACAPGGIAGTASCQGQNLRAIDPLTGAILGPGSSAAIGSGDPTNGVFAAGTGPVARTTYEWPGLVVAPRFGFAYDLTGSQRVVLRGGAGLFFDRPNGGSQYGQVSNPPASVAATVTNGTLQDLAGGLQLRAPAALTVFEYDADIPASAQWSTGLQFAGPWSSTIDVAYVGLYGYNLLNEVDINNPDFGAAYLPENQNPALSAGAVPGASALPANFLRPFQGYGAINRTMSVGYNKFHSMQASINRRFRNGLQFTVNYTLGRNKGTDRNGVRVGRDASGAIVLRPDQDRASYHLEAVDRTHVLRATFVWDLPDLHRSGAAGSVLSAAVNDWQLSGVFSAASGAPYTVGFAYQGGITATNLTGTPSYNARIVIAGNPGSGCSSDPTRQFETAAFQGPQPGSLGLESGLNYMRGCADHTLDLAIARSFRLGGARRLQVRLEAFNALDSVVYTGRNATMQIGSLSTATTAVNAPYDATGNLIAGRDLPRSAGFGVVNAVAPPRSVQAHVRFEF
jgi:hypothetical protein